jgi:hypothetical protein
MPVLRARSIIVAEQGNIPPQRLFLFQPRTREALAHATQTTGETLWLCKRALSPL